MKKFYSCFFVTMLVVLLILPVMADTSLSDAAYFYDPLGGPEGWSFEGDPNGWTTNNGGYRTGSNHLDGSYSWYTSGGREYYMWRYVDTSHALNAIKGKKVKFSFSFDPAVTIVNGGFEDGNMSSWIRGGTGDHRRTWPWEESHSGKFSMLIGYNSSSPVANSRDWAYQTVTIPSTAKNTIFSFWYRMYTEDYEPYNWFEVYIRDSSGNNIERIFYRAGMYPNPGLEVFGWEQVTYNLTKYAGQTIQLYFAVANMVDTLYKTWVYIDDVVIENEARAEVYYEYTTSGGGGGCPYVRVWDSTQYVLDNNLMPSSEFTAGDVVDYYLLQQPLAPDDEGMYRFMLSEFEEEHSFFDQVQLLAVDHPSNVNVAISPYGEVLTYVNPHPPVSAITNEKRSVKELLSSIDGNYYEGYNGSYIILNFGDELNISQCAKLVIRSDVITVKSPIYVQTMDSEGEWQTVATIHTRTRWSIDIIDMSKYLPDARGNLKVRLYFASNDRIDFVGLDTCPQATINMQQAELISAIHFKNGDPTVCNGSLEIDVKSKLLSYDSDYAELMPHEQIKLAFTLADSSDDLVRDFILISKGHYRTLPPGTLIDPTVYGYWIAPTSYDWHIVEVVVDLPSTTTLVKVIIHGRTDFQAYIDNAIFTITDIKKIETDKGTLSVSLEIISWRPINQTHDEVRATVNLAAYPKNPYKIRTIKLQTELVPSTQNAKLHIEYAGQSNDMNYVVDPAAVEKQQYDVFNAIAFVVGYAAGSAAGVLVTVYAPPWALPGGALLTKAFVSEVTNSGLLWVLSHTASDPDNKDAGVGTSYSAVWEQWPYPTGPFDGVAPFVSEASGHYELLWQFNKDSADTFQITTTAWVNWGKVYSYWHDYTDGFYYALDDSGWTSESLTFTVYA